MRGHRSANLLRAEGPHSHRLPPPDVPTYLRTYVPTMYTRWVSWDTQVPEAAYLSNLQEPRRLVSDWKLAIQPPCLSFRQGLDILRSATIQLLTTSTTSLLLSSSPGQDSSPLSLSSSTRDSLCSDYFEQAPRYVPTDCRQAVNIRNFSCQSAKVQN
jgi:hypothetical protein